MCVHMYVHCMNVCMYVYACVWGGGGRGYVGRSVMCMCDCVCVCLCVCLKALGLNNLLGNVYN